MISYTKPLPGINSDNRPFWEGCKQHELRFQKCTDCGLVRWPPAFLCPRCHSQQTSWCVSGGTGKVFTYAVYYRAFHPAFSGDLPYVVAVVILDEGLRLLTNLIGCRPDQVKCDMPVRVSWDDVTEEITLPKFMPFP